MKASWTIETSGLPLPLCSDHHGFIMNRGTGGLCTAARLGEAHAHAPHGLGAAFLLQVKVADRDHQTSSFMSGCYGAELLHSTAHTIAL